MTTVYIAEDGQKFYDEDACRDYEQQLLYKKMAGNIRGLNVMHDEILFPDSDFCDDVQILYLDTDEAAEVFMDRCEEENVSSYGIRGAGVYTWDDRDDEWENIENTINGYRAKIKELEQLISFLKND